MSDYDEREARKQRSKQVDPDGPYDGGVKKPQGPPNPDPPPDFSGLVVSLDSAV